MWHNNKDNKFRHFRNQIINESSHSSFRVVNGDVLAKAQFQFEFVGFDKGLLNCLDIWVGSITIWIWVTL